MYDRVVFGRIANKMRGGDAVVRFLQFVRNASLGLFPYAAHFFRPAPAVRFHRVLFVRVVQ